MCVLRCGFVDFFIVMDVMEVVCCVEEVGWYVIYMEVGQLGIGVLKVVLDWFKGDLDGGSFGYIVVLGVFELCQWIVWLYGDWYNVDMDLDRVVVIVGVLGVFLLVFIVFFDIGEWVGLGVLCYLFYC